MHGSSYMFQHYIAIIRERSSAFWEMVNWEEVDRILWMGMLCLVTAIDFSSIEHLSEGTRTLPDDGNVMSKYVGATMHN
jgi:hypothetical protein